MAQGKAFTPEQRTTIIESLRPHLELGFSRNKACALVGMDPTTLSVWVQNDEALSIKLQSWENTTTALAMANIQMAIRKEAETPDDIRKENSWRWAERKEESMKPKQDVTSNNKELPVPILSIPSVHTDDSNKEDSGAN